MTIPAVVFQFSVSKVDVTLGLLYQSEIPEKYPENRNSNKVYFKSERSGVILEASELV